MSISEDVARLQGAKAMLISKMTAAWYEASARNSLQELVAMLDLGQGADTPAVYPSGTLSDQIDRLSDVRDKLAEKMTASGDYTLTGDELLDELVAMLNVPRRADPAYCLTYSSPSAFKVTATKAWDGTMLYRTPNMTDWQKWEGEEIYSSGGKIWFQGIRNTTFGGYGFAVRGISSTYISLYVDGNIETILDWQTVSNGRHPTMASNCFQRFFAENLSLIRSPYLGGMSLTAYCYSFMYFGCKNLKEVPDFPAWTSVSGYYSCEQMFEKCSSLITAPALPSKVLGQYIYEFMFHDCTSLTKAPDLPAPTLERYCYQYMFYNCTSLVRAPALSFTGFRDSNAYTSCRNMFQGCTALKYAPLLYADKLTGTCYLSMFLDCSNLKFSATQSTGYSYPYPLGKTYYSGAQNPLLSMFRGTGGTLTDPTIDMVGTTVYCATEPVAA